MLKLSCFLLFVIGFVSGVQVVFDKEIDKGNILEISCPYNDDYADFFVYKCPREPKEEVSPDTVGFWTGCNAPCTLTYFGGLLPKPKKLLVAAYMEGGESAISVEGKAAPTDPEYGIDFGKIETGDEKWCYREVELEGEGGSSPGVINFDLTGSPAGGYVLVDSIIFDLGDQPISPISIDTKTDELVQHWPYDDCQHVSNYDDLATMDCPVVPEEVNPTPEAVGYWSPCQQESCKIQYATSPSFVPNSVTFKGYLEGDGVIMIKLVSGTGNNNFTVIDTKSAKLAGWIEVTQDLTSYKQYKLDIVLQKGNGGIAMLDSISYSFPQEDVTKRQNDLPLCNPKQITTTSPPTSPTTPEVTATTPPTQQTTRSSVTSVIPTSIVFICLVVARMCHF